MSLNICALTVLGILMQYLDFLLVYFYMQSLKIVALKMCRLYKFEKLG